MNDYDNLSTREYLQALFAGKIPLRGAKGISYIMPDGEEGLQTVFYPRDEAGQTYFDDSEVYLPRLVRRNMPDWYMRQAEIERRQRGYEDKYAGSPLWTGLRAMDSEDWLDVGRKSLLGAEHVIDGGSGNGYSYLNRYVGGTYNRRSEEMHNLAKNAGLEQYNMIAENGLKTLASSIGGTGVRTIFTLMNMKNRDK